MNNDHGGGRWVNCSYESFVTGIWILEGTEKQLYPANRGARLETTDTGQLCKALTNMLNYLDRRTCWDYKSFLFSVEHN